MNKIILIAIYGVITLKTINGQEVLTLDKVLTLAKQYSLEYQENKNTFLADYWEYKEFKLNLLPKISFNATPISARRMLTERYDFENNIDIYRENKSINSSTGITLSQPLLFSGGSISVSSNLSRSQNFGIQDYTLFSSTPFRISLSQPLFSFNSFKWDKKELPLKLTKAKQTLIQSEQHLNQRVSKLYFNMVKAFHLHKLAQQELINADSLLKIEQKLLELNETTPLELVEIELKKTNAKINLDKRKQNLITASFQLNKILRGHLPPNYKPATLNDIPALKLNTLDIMGKAKYYNPFYLNIEQQKLHIQRRLEQVKKQNKLSANLNLSYGLNQQGKSFSSGYKKPLDQQTGSISISIPIFNGGINKGKLLLTKRNLVVEELKLEAQITDFEQKLANTVLESIRNQSIITNSLLSKELAQKTYKIKKQQYQLGKITLQELNLTYMEMLHAEENYIESISNFWINFYEIQSLTLHDLILNKPLQADFERLMELL